MWLLAHYRKTFKFLNSQGNFKERLGISQCVESFNMRWSENFLVRAWSWTYFFFLFNPNILRTMFFESDNCLLLRNQTAQAMVYIIWISNIKLTPCRQEKTDTFQRQMDMFWRKEITDKCCLHRCDISKSNVGKKMYVLEVSCVLIYPGKSIAG